MSFTLLALLILWVVLPLASASGLRRMGLPAMIAALTLTSAIMAGLIVVLVTEVGDAPAFTAVAGKDESTPLLRPLDLTLSLMAAGGVALIVAGLAQRGRGHIAAAMASLGLALCHAGAFIALLMAATPLRGITEAPVLSQGATLALGSGAVLVLGGLLLVLLRGLRLG